MLTMFASPGESFDHVMVAAGEGLGVGIQKNQELLARSVMIVFAGRTSMHGGGDALRREESAWAKTTTADREEAPACKYVMPELGNDVQVPQPFNSGTIPTRGCRFSLYGNSPHHCAQGRSTMKKTTPKLATVAFLGQ